MKYEKLKNGIGLLIAWLLALSMLYIVYIKIKNF